MVEITEYFRDVQGMLGKISLDQLEQVLRILEEAYSSRHCIFIMGNGGSAATATHFACDLAKSTIVGSAARVKAIALTDNVSLLTAWANDAGYENIFAEQLLGLLEADDVVIAFTTSGNSPNILKALSIANQLGARTVALLGGNGGVAKMMAHVTVVATGRSIEQEEDVHLILAHVIARHMRTFVRHYSEGSS